MNNSYPDFFNPSDICGVGDMNSVQHMVIFPVGSTQSQSDVNFYDISFAVPLRQHFKICCFEFGMTDTEDQINKLIHHEY